MDRRKAFQLAATLLALCAVILSLLPNGMGMVFLGETSPIQYIVSPCPILSLTAVGYGMPFPFLSGVLAIALVVLGILGLFLDRPGLRGAQFYLSLLALSALHLPSGLFPDRKPPMHLGQHRLLCPFAAAFPCGSTPAEIKNRAGCKMRSRPKILFTFSKQCPSRSSSWQAFRRWRKCRPDAPDGRGCTGRTSRPPPSCGPRRLRRRTTWS